MRAEPTSTTRLELVTRWAAPVLAAALLVGATVGAVAVLDPVVTPAVRRLLPGGSLRALGDVPYLLSITAVLLGLAGALCIRYRRAIVTGRISIAVAAVMVTSHLTAIGKGPFNPLTVVIVLLLGLWVLERLTRLDAPWRVEVFHGLVVLFLGAMLLSAFGRRPSEILPGLVTNAPKVLLAVLLVDFLENRPAVRRAIDASLWAAGLVALAGLGQVLLSYVWGLDISMAEPHYRYAHIGSLSILRATGFSRFANQFAPPLVVACLIGLYLLPSRAGAGRRWPLAILIALTAAAVGFSLARGSWVALGIGAILIPWMKRPERSLHWFGLAVGILALGMATGAFPRLLRYVNHLSESGMEERTALLGSGLMALVQHPWSGVGVGNFGSYSPTFERPPVHNALLQIGSELGVPGLLVYAALILWVGLRLWLAARRTTDPIVKSELGALLVGLLALLVVIQAEPMGYSQFVWLYLALAEAAVRCLPPALEADLKGP